MILPKGTIASRLAASKAPAPGPGPDNSDADTIAHQDELALANAEIERLRA
jgi:hypothetical protein